MPPPRRPGLHAAFFRHLLICGLSATLAIARCPAQGPADGALHGLIRDPLGQPAAHASLVLINEDSGHSTETQTASDGSFLLPHLAPGVYRVTVEGQRLPRRVYAAVEVHPGETSELPSNPNAIAAPEPADPTEPDENDDGLLSAHGLASIQTATLLDGVSLTQGFGSVPVGVGTDPAPDPEGDGDSADLTTGPTHGLGRGRHKGAVSAYAQGSIREFRTGHPSYSAAIGHAGGVVALATSRGGSQHLHGSAYFGLRSQAFAAHDPLAIATSYSDGLLASINVKPHDLRDTLSLAIGGPVLARSHTLSFFYNFDLQRRGFPAISSPADPNFYTLTATQRALLANRGVTSAQVNASLNFLSSLTGATNRRADQTLHFGRLDWQPARAVSLALQYNRVRWDSPAGLIDAPVVARGRASLGTASGSLDAIVLHATTRFGARTTNQGSLSFLRDLQFETPQTPLPQEPAIAPGGLAPEVNIGPNGLLFGTPASLSRQAYPDERRLQVLDTVTLVRGHHLLQLGGEVSLLRDQVATLANAAGTFRYDSPDLRGYAGGLVDFITDATFNVHTSPNGGCPAITAATHLFCFRSFSQSFGGESVAFSTQDWGAFVEDTWRPLPGLTLTAGARYEYTLLPLPMNPNPALDAVFGTRAATSIFPEDRNNLGPRLALAWRPQPEGTLTVHAGYGVFFGRLPGATLRAALSDTARPGSTTRIRIAPSASIPCPQVPVQGFGYPCTFLAQPAGVVAQTTSAMAFDRRFRLPMIQQGSLGVERTVGRASTLSATYVFNIDRQLPGSTDLNIAPSTATRVFTLQGGTGARGVRSGESFVLPIYTARITPSFGPVTDIVSDVNATYHGVIVTADSHPHATLRLHIAYTYSKAIDFGQTQSATPRTNGQFDPFTNGYDKGLSALNYPWSLHASVVWAPTVMGPKALRRTLSGWQLTPLLTARSGRPYSLDLSGGPLLPGGHHSLNGSGGALYLPTVGRNTLRLPATVKTDLRLARTFRVGPRANIDGSAEAFNLLNHRNVSSVVQRAFVVGSAAGGVTPLIFQDAAAIAAEGLNTQPFGTPNAASTSLSRGRQIQFSLKLEF